MKNCITCKHMVWENNHAGYCNYPLPACVKKYKIIRGVWCMLNDVYEGTDYSKVGYQTEDNSIIEIRDCPLHENKESKEDLYRNVIASHLLAYLKLITAEDYKTYITPSKQEVEEEYSSNLLFGNAVDSIVAELIQIDKGDS